MKNILISVSKNADSGTYLRAVAAVGGQGYAVYAPKDCSKADGVILAGGMDVAPFFYGRPNNGSQGIDLVRDRAEFHCLEQCAANQKPVLGICRGIQVLNVFWGGTLIQHLRNARLHKAKNGVPVEHVLDGKGMLASLYGRRFVTNSAHHQAVDQLAKNLQVIARCGRVIEAVQHIHLPMIGVQFHPELMSDGDKLIAAWLEKC